MDTKRPKQYDDLTDDVKDLIFRHYLNPADSMKMSAVSKWDQKIALPILEKLKLTEMKDRLHNVDKTDWAKLLFQYRRRLKRGKHEQDLETMYRYGFITDSDLERVRKRIEGPNSKMFCTEDITRLEIFLAQLDRLLWKYHQKHSKNIVETYTGIFGLFFESNNYFHTYKTKKHHKNRKYLLDWNDLAKIKKGAHIIAIKDWTDPVVLKHDSFQITSDYFHSLPEMSDFPLPTSQTLWMKVPNNDVDAFIDKVMHLLPKTLNKKMQEMLQTPVR